MERASVGSANHLSQFWAQFGHLLLAAEFGDTVDETRVLRVRIRDEVCESNGVPLTFGPKHL